MYHLAGESRKRRRKRKRNVHRKEEKRNRKEKSGGVKSADSLSLLQPFSSACFARVPPLPAFPPQRPVEILLSFASKLLRLSGVQDEGSVL
jgi:hypothetical protein